MLQIIGGILVGFFLIVGLFFAGVGVFGILFFPDFNSRSQASTTITTLGTLGAIISGILYCLFSGLAAIWWVKLVMIALMIMLSGAVSAHSLAKGTYKRGHRPHHGGFVKDDYKEDGFDEF